jgi:hypothetical protein
MHKDTDKRLPIVCHDCEKWPKFKYKYGEYMIYVHESCQFWNSHCKLQWNTPCTSLKTQFSEAYEGRRRELTPQCYPQTATGTPWQRPSHTEFVINCNVSYRHVVKWGNPMKVLASQHWHDTKANLKTDLWAGIAARNTEFQKAWKNDCVCFSVWSLVISRV